MWKIALVALLLAACGRRHPAPPAALTIAITHDGFVKLDGKAVTLDELGALVAAAREGVAEEGHPYGGRVSSLRVTLDIEEDALWRHVLMVIDVLAEQKVWRVTFPGGRDWPLPADSWHELSPDGKALLTRVLVLENGTYAVGDLVAGDVKEVGRWIDSEPTKDILCRIATIRAASRVPWRLVHPVFDILRSGGSKRIDFYGVFPGQRASPGVAIARVPSGDAVCRVVGILGRGPLQAQHVRESWARCPRS